MPPDFSFGFFIDGDVFDARVAAAKRTQRTDRANIIDANAVGCANCALRETWGHIKTNKMHISGNVHDADILVLGDAPSSEEDLGGKQFIGKIGRILRDNLPRRHLDRIAFQHAVRCHPTNNHVPTVKEVHACSVHLDADIDALPLKVIIGAGAVPLHKYFPGAQIMKLHGTRFPVRTKRGPVWYYPVLHPSFLLHLAEERDRDDSPALPVFESDMRHLFNELDRWEAPYIHDIKGSDVIIVNSISEARAILAQMQSPVGIDVETSRLHPYEMDAKILTASVSDGNYTIAWVCEHPEAPTTWGLELLLEVILTKRWIAHNASFELGWFNWYWPDYVDTIQPFEDSMALGRLYHQRKDIISLEDLSVVHLGVNVKNLSPVDPRHIMDYPLEEVLPYNGIDALSSALLWRKLHNKVNQLNYERILGASIATNDMELGGLPIDLSVSMALEQKWSKRQQDIETRVSQLPEVKQFENDRAIAFNVHSDDHVGIALTAYGGLDLPFTGNTKKVTWKTDEISLQPFVGTNELAKCVLDVREATKMQSTYIRPLKEVPKRYTDGRLHGSYTTMFTHPFRLSSVDPNMQNFPGRKHGEVRTQVVADAGCVLVKFDYGQLQIRIEGMETKDRHLCEILIKGADMHSDWLNHILDFYPDYWLRMKEKTGETEEAKIRKGGRDLVKSDFVFANLFGATIKSVAERTGIPQHIVQQIVTKFWTEFKDVLTWIKARRDEYRDKGTVTSMTGHTRRGILWGNEPINAPIQFGEATIVMDAMNELSRMARREKNFFLAPRIQIHDDLTFMLPLGNELEAYINTIQAVLIRKRFPWQIVPLNVEGSIGANWGAFEKFATFTGDYYK